MSGNDDIRDVQGGAGPEHFILLFAKYPQLGRVKTRLVPLLGEAGATAFARAALIDSLHVYHTCPGRLVWCFAPSTEEPLCRELLESEGVGTEVELRPQPDVVDLGERLRAALDSVQRLCTDDRATVTFVGADCFEIDAGRVEASQAVARSHRASLLRATDGGYVLLTLPVRTPLSVFEGIEWSCSTTAMDQRRQIEAAGLAVVQPEDRWRDVDVPEDLGMFEEPDLRKKLKKTHPKLSQWIARYRSHQ